MTFCLTKISPIQSAGSYIEKYTDKKQLLLWYKSSDVSSDVSLRRGSRPSLGFQRHKSLDPVNDAEFYKQH